MIDKSAGRKPRQKHVKGPGAPFWPLALLPLAYAALLAAASDLRGEILGLGLLTIALWAAGGETRRILLLLYPAVAILLAFDAFRYVRPLYLTPDRVLGCELRAADLALFQPAADATWPDFFVAHHAPWADLVFALPYAGFVYVVAAYGVLLYFRDRRRLSLLVWAFALMYLIAMIVWVAAPAAPPWYIREHGCAIDINAAPSAGAALLRVDRMLGLGYFESFYSRAPNLFGAMPSLHNGFAMMGLLVTWPIAGWKERLANLAYTVWMIVASLYLDHHWLLDGLAGWLCAAVAVGLSCVIVGTWPSPGLRKSP